MADYVERTLASGERIVVRGRWPLLHWIIAYAWLILLGIVIIGIVVYLSMVIRMLTTEFAVTNRRVVLKYGLIRRSTQELAIDAIEGVSLRQTIAGRIFRFGQVYVTGTGDAFIAFPPMADPFAFRRAIESGRSEGKEMRLSAQDVNKIAAKQAAEARRSSQGPRFIGVMRR